MLSLVNDDDQWEFPLKIIKSAFLAVLARIKMIIAQNNMTKSLLVTSITGHNIAKNKERDPRTVAKAIFCWIGPRIL